MSYLGLPLGGNPRALSFWNPVVEKVEKKKVAKMEKGMFIQTGSAYSDSGGFK